jgi:hypothetical protein
MQGSGIQTRLVHACHKALYRYWWSQRTTDDLPFEHRFDLAQTEELAPFIGIVEVTRKDSRLYFRHRYCGAEIVRQTGRDLTGLWFWEAHAGDELRRSHANHVEVTALRRPALSQEVLPLAEGGGVIYDRLLLPLIGDERLIEAIVHLPVFLGRNGSPLTLPAGNSEILTDRRTGTVRTIKA